MANTRLTKTFSGASNRKTMTFSFWVKRTKISSGMYIANAGAGGNPEAGIEFNSDDTFTFWEGGVYNQKPTRKFRDPNAWYHFVIAVDTTQATEANRVKIYVNGVQETVMTTNTFPSQNADLSWNTTLLHTIGAYYGGSMYFDGILSHFHFIDGTQYQASDFGETDTTTGEWKINTSPTVTYGTNGFFILKDGNSVTDQSGNSNNFTVAGGTLTNTEDCPSNVFATLNPLAGNCTFSNGNNTWVGTQSGYEHSSATLGASLGKYYWEVKPNSACGAMGITDPTWQFNRKGSIIYASSSQSYIYEGNGYVSHDSYGDIASNYSSYTSSDIIGVALDLDNNKLYFHKNGTYENSGVPTSGSTGTGAISIEAPSTLFTGFYTPLVADLCSATTGGGDCNFGNGYFGTTAISSEGTNASGIGKFEYDVPTGYTALSTKGLNE